MQNSLFSSHLLIMKTTKLLLLFSLLMIRNSNSQQLEVEALLQLKQNLNDPQNHLINWKTSPSPCHFSGITCNSTSGQVTSLSLPNMKLSGKLSPYIATLQSLTVLNFGENSISGPLPSELMNCINLQLLNLSSNGFNGHLPDFSSLKNLQVLDLSSNAFSGGFPPWLGNLTALVYLGLASNKFDESEIPEIIGKLKYLKVLFLAQCNLVGQIPVSIFELTELETLDLSQNQLTGDFPVSISNLLNLHKLELYQNKLTGSIPSELANLVQLHEFDVSQNQMSGKLPVELANLKNLTVFQLFRNNFSGELPAGFGDFQHLIGLSLYENSFSGELPKNLGRFSPLISIDISENNFSGRFPPFLCESNKLQYLLALQNNFSGQFPGTYSTCKSLVRFRISQNQFEGMIPNSLWGLPFAAIIDVADNGFSGDIHADIGISTSLIQLYVNNNKLSGRIPRQIGNLSSLISLHLEQNEFSGPIPSELGYCTKLAEINIARNLLNGGIPETFSLLNSLNSLNVSRNFLTGTIPESLQTLKLTSIDFSDNKLSGMVPPGLLMIAGEEAFSGNAELCFSETSGSCNTSHRHKSKMSKALMLLLIMLAAMVLFSVLVFRTFKSFMFETRSKEKDQEKITEKDQVWKMESFNTEDIKAEEIFFLDDKNLIGSGRTGKVYRSELKNKGNVAVKQLFNGTQISTPELDMLKNIKHKNILKLYACLTKGGSNFLVFEYIPRGNLHQALRRKTKTGQPELDWSIRYKIALSAAKAIMYLHHDCSPAILHKNIKSSNILLDDQYEAKIAVKLELSDFSGTNCYMAPELAYSIKPSEKSDVYSFGVVLLELITGYSPVEPKFGKGKDIVYWVSTQINSENVAEILDSSLSENAIEDMIKVLKVAMLCTTKLPAVRPLMTGVVRMLIDAEPCCMLWN
ncbi:receptor protein-tyrosine kinase CEPR2-like isoform X2 [Dioscorea cayenensis subsp. rotundata]|uniref:Receptor protein-tyrosine kinase CEPR2-like isoform X2 n=1 Tax=Dioscorea cayennensis subsp. rotundata TaxID=55577 RepID=A0AB40BBY5_DIOCR|nr:receptor protein-tyrosine kinase CEPR2-like isoform X2 [Dioscorea cayenensis subsp. rotundata]